MRDSGVSEILGGLLAISIVFSGIAIIGIYLTSTPPPEAFPQISFLVYCCSDGPGYSVLISHQGGDTIKWSDIRFNINPEDGTNEIPCCSYTGDVDSSTNVTSGTGWSESSQSDFFKTGDTLKIVTAVPPERLLIIKTAGTNHVILDTKFTCFVCNS